MEILQFTSSEPFNSVFTIYVHMTAMVAPLLATIGLFGGK